MGIVDIHTSISNRATMLFGICYNVTNMLVVEYRFQQIFTVLKIQISL